MKDKKKAKNTTMIFVIVGLLLVIGLVALVFLNNKIYKMNEKVKVNEQNITLMVKSYDTYTIENEYEALGLPSLVAGDYYKVEIEMTNNGTEEYKRIATNFVLVDTEGERTAGSLVVMEEDVEDLLPATIEPNKTVTGSIYFDKELANNKTFGTPEYLNYEIIQNGKTKVYSVKLK